MKTKLILDTDIDMDADDAGALAVLHDLIRQEKLDLLGIICSAPCQWCEPYVHALNAWYHRESIPVAKIRESDWAPKELEEYKQKRIRYGEERNGYNEIIGKEWLERNPGKKPIEAVRLYRELLAGEPDQSVTICAIGSVTALVALLRSQPDELSPLSGKELAEKKVKLCVVEATTPFPKGRDVFNWKIDLPSAEIIVNEWPTKIIISPLVNSGARAGKRFIATVPEDHPVSRGYQIHLGTKDKDLHCADLQAVLFASKTAESFYRIKEGYEIKLNVETGEHEWITNQGNTPDRGYLELAVSKETMSQHLEDLMVGIHANELLEKV